MARRISPLRDFLKNESSSGALLLLAALIGLLVANSPLADGYFSALEWSFKIDSGGFYLSLSLLKVINYALMTIFFFVVGLEIKRELTSGHLASVRKAAAPFFAALGGMALPAILYLAIAGSDAPEGWAIPVATDIALAVGVLALMGSRVSQSLKTFLLALAVIDDIGAILIIAIIYSTGILLSWMLAAFFLILLVLMLQRANVTRIFVYVIVGVSLWYALYRAGVHPTLAGVIMGVLTPARKAISDDIDIEDGELTIVERLEAKIHPISSLFIVPVFAFANSGVKLSSAAISEALQSPIALGIFIGLVFGKPIGIFVATFAAARIRLAELPEGASRAGIFATGSTAGIGFTVAIFIARLAFKDPATQDLAIIAVIVASLVSALISALIFKTLKKR